MCIPAHRDIRCFVKIVDRCKLEVPCISIVDQKEAVDINEVMHFCRLSS